MSFWTALLTHFQMSLRSDYYKIYVIMGLLHFNLKPETGPASPSVKSDTVALLASSSYVWFYNLSFGGYKKR